MARSAGIAVENSFVKGLITEATALNFPENAVTDCDNTVFDPTGLVTRRLGFNLEADYQVNSHIGEDGAYNEFVWKTVDNAGSKQFVVICRGDRLSFYDVNGAGSVSSQREAYTVNLNTYKTAGSPALETEVCQFAVGDGRLVVVHPFMTPIVIDYDIDTNTISTSEINVQVRDFEGVEDGLAVDQRPLAILTPRHNYNLFNQGWYQNVTATDSAGNFVNNINAAVGWFNARSNTDWPSDSDVWWYFKGSFVENPNVADFRPGYVNSFAFGNTPAGKGHYIFNAFNINRSSIVAGLPNEDNTTSGFNRPSCVDFFQGRIFYSGVNTKKYNNKIFFSKVIENLSDYGKCYQVNDPTSEELSDLLPTDGGEIVINEADRIVALFNSGGNLYVLAENGTWLVTGPDQSGFAADSYVVRRISNIGCSAPLSVVDVDGIPVWWNFEGIYTVIPNEIGSTATVESITEPTIQKFFEAIPQSEIEFVKGAYDTVEKKIRWVFRNQEAETISEHFRYNRFLDFDVRAQSFSPSTIGQVFNAGNYAYIKGITYVVGKSSSISVEEVVDSTGDVVTDSLGNPVTANVVLSSNIGSSFLFPLDVRIASGTEGISFGQVFDTSFTDLVALGGINYQSFFTTGYKLRGESMRNQQNSYLTITSLVEENSGFLVSGRWDFYIESAGRWSTKQQGYKPSFQQSYSQRRLKIRGKGPVLQYHVESQTGKPFNIVGWATLDTISNNV